MNLRIQCVLTPWNSGFTACGSGPNPVKPRIQCARLPVRQRAAQIDDEMPDFVPPGGWKPGRSYGYDGRVCGYLKYQKRMFH